MKHMEWTEPPAVVCGTVLVGTGTVAVANQTSNTGPILAFSAIIVGGLLTAYFAQRRLRDQLTAEAERNEQRLEAEDRRIASQLEHDRELKAMELNQARRMAEAEHLREFFDHALNTASDGVESLMEIYRLLELGREASHQELAEAKRASVGISLQLDHIGRRMDLRLAATDPARAALLEFIDIMDSTYELLTSQQLPADERERKYLGNGGNLVHAMRRFGEAARSYIGAAERGETG